MEVYPVRKAFSRIGFALVIFLILPPYITYGIYSVIGWLAPQLLQVAWLNTLIPFISMFLVALSLTLPGRLVVLGRVSKQPPASPAPP